MQISSLGSVAAAPTRTAFGAKPLVIAHRGYHDGADAYENTVDAYRRAAKLGVDLMETDVRRTADGVLILHHDAYLGGRLIADTNFADLPRLPNGQVVSTLQGLVDAVAGAGGGTRILVETKEHGYEAQIIATLYTKLKTSQFELMSFDQKSVRAMRVLAPDAKVGVLFGLWPDWEHGTWPISGAAIVAKAKELGVDFVALDRLIANDARLDVVAAAGIDIAVWTINSPEELQRRMRDPRIRRIITDHPDTAMSMRDAILRHAGSAAA